MRIAFATIVLLAVAVISGPGAWGAYVDITNTGDPVDGFNADGPGADWPGAENPPNAIDNRMHKYLNFGTTGGGSGSGTGGPTGIIVTPSGSAFAGTSASWDAAPVVGLRLRTAGDAPRRDPEDYLLEGSNDGGLNWTQIAEGVTGLDGFQGRNTWMTAPIIFPNDTAYPDYRLGFNIVGPENSMQIGEVEFLANDTDVFNGSVSLTEGAVGVAVPDNGNWPSDGLPRNALDNDPLTKYLHFNILNTGMDITPVAGNTIVTWIGLTSGNDHPERDPIDYELYGSNDNGQSFALIASGSVPLFDARHEDVYIDLSDNTWAYDQYRILFPHVLDNNPDPNRPTDSMQISELRLYGDLPPHCGDLRPDFDDDGDVDQTDAAILQLDLGQARPGSGCTDLNADGLVNTQDMAIHEACNQGAQVPLDPENLPAGCVISE